MFAFLTESLWNNEQSKKKKEKNDKNNWLIGFLRGQILDSTTKSWKIIGNVLEVL